MHTNSTKKHSTQKINFFFKIYLYSVEMNLVKYRTKNMQTDNYNCVCLSAVNNPITNQHKNNIYIRNFQKKYSCVRLVSISDIKQPFWKFKYICEGQDLHVILQYIQVRGTSKTCKKYKRNILKCIVSQMIYFTLDQHTRNRNQPEYVNLVRYKNCSRFFKGEGWTWLYQE